MVRGLLEESVLWIQWSQQLNANWLHKGGALAPFLGACLWTPNSAFANRLQAIFVCELLVDGVEHRQLQVLGIEPKAAVVLQFPLLTPKGTFDWAAMTPKCPCVGKKVNEVKPSNKRARKVSFGHAWHSGFVC